MLVGHSYGGVVITNAATGNANVKALVYVAAFAPDAGRIVLALAQPGNDGQLGPAPLHIRPFPNAGRPHRSGARHRAGGLPRGSSLPTCRPQARPPMALSQRPRAVGLGEPSGLPGGRPSRRYYMVAGADKTIGTDVEHAMAKRIKPNKNVTVKGALARRHDPQPTARRPT